jgi:hypothetical protein
VSLPDEITTGSSIMPQKRNPDVFELVRGRSAVAQAALNEVLGITQKLSSGYHRDLQLIKPPLFRGIDSCRQTLDILPSALRGVHFKPDGSGSIPAFTPPRPPTRWWPRRAFRSARRIGASRRSSSLQCLRRGRRIFDRPEFRRADPSDRHHQRGLGRRHHARPEGRPGRQENAASRSAAAAVVHQID